MRKITATQILSFSAMLAAILALAFGTSWSALKHAPLGRFDAIVITGLAVLLIYLFAFIAYRLFLWFVPLTLGPMEPGSRGEFAVQVNILF